MQFLYGLIAILGIGVLMIVHEGGHYLAARMFGMRVLRFSIGIGPTIWRRQIGEHGTIFQVAAVPFLAYVQIAGMNPYEEVDPNDRSLFPNQGVLARITTIIAGPLANYLFAVLVVFCIALVGWPDPRAVSKVVEGSPAEAAGLQVGDLVVRAEGTTIEDVEDLKRVTQPRGGEPTRYEILRHGARRTLTITPSNEGGTGRIGVELGNDGGAGTYSLPIGQAAAAALRWPAERVAIHIEGLKQLYRAPSVENLSGPAGMVDAGARFASRGMTPFVLFVAFISTALAVFNMLPFPGLDGGRLMFLTYEVVARRRVNERVEMFIHVVGLVLLLGLMVLVTFNDIARIFS